MSAHGTDSKRRVLIAGGGVAALETLLALRALAPELTEITVLAPNAEFVYRPMTVREPFSYPEANRYAIAPIVREAGAQLVVDELAWVDPEQRIAHTSTDAEIPYDALVLALGARARPRYEHALTIDDRRLDKTMHGLIQDVEEGYVKSIAFVSPGRMAWPLPLYELALMTAGRAYDMNVEVAITLVTPEDSPLAIFGKNASDTVAELLAQARIETIHSAYAEVPRAGEVVINPGGRQLQVNRVVALPELYGPGVRGLPLSEHGFYRIDVHGKLVDVDHIYAAGDATEFAVKFGGIAAQQADALAEAIAALAGAPITPEPFHPVIHGILLTGDKPRYLTARITGGQGFSSEISDTPSWAPATKIAAKYLAPYLARLDGA
ncbi:MAG TPA: FAD-dependent oxidoreductase [Solirubrobacteraceae bacterium]|jgi:sulfide:quinone oxidoreductase|nr:FAD-dependent oxidoreductase [Solirubrobacteraceae bacterium]